MVKTTYCIETTCTGIDLVGAHVQNVNSTDNKWYIIPLCKEHNKSQGEIDVLGTYKFVLANKKKTCDKD